MREQLRFVRANDQIVLLCNGQLVTSFPSQVGREIIDALNKQVLAIENDANPEKTVMDQAVLHRKGINIGLSDSRKIMAEAHKEAQWNRDLRRALRATDGVPSTEVVGTPMLTNHSEDTP